MRNETNREYIVTAVTAVLVILVLLVAGCEDKNEKWRFKEGQLVESVLDGRLGMVIYRRGHPNNQAFYVRFSQNSAAVDTGLLGSGKVSRKPYALVYMQPFELREVKK